MAARPAVGLGVAVAICAIVACSAFGAGDDDVVDTAPKPSRSDASVLLEASTPQNEDAGTPCDPAAPFEDVSALVGADDDAGAVNTPLAERGATLSRDELTLYFHREETTVISSILIATRDAPSGAFRAPTKVVMQGNGTRFDANPALSPDGAWLYFDSDRGGPQGIFNHSLWRSPRSNLGVLGEPMELTTLSRPLAEPFLTTDDELLFARTPGNGAYTIDRAKPVLGGSSALPDTINVSSSANTHPVMSADRRSLYFARKTATVPYQIYRSTRVDVNGPFPEATPLAPVGFAKGPLNLNVTLVQFAQSPLWISDDNCRLYFEKTPPAPEQYDLFVATRTPAKIAQ